VSCNWIAFCWLSRDYLHFLFNLIPVPEILRGGPIIFRTLSDFFHKYTCGGDAASKKLCPAFPLLGEDFQTF
jgi:hypothetical protein